MPKTFIIIKTGKTSRAQRYKRKYNIEICLFIKMLNSLKMRTISNKNEAKRPEIMNRNGDSAAGKRIRKLRMNSMRAFRNHAL